MSMYLRDTVNRIFIKASMLMQKGKHKDALIELEKAEELAKKINATDIFLRIQTMKGEIKQTLNEYEEALKIYSLTLKKTEDLLSKDPCNEIYQSIIQKNLYNIDSLGELFYEMGRFPQAEDCCELQILVLQKLLENDSENKVYKINIANVLNNYGILLNNTGLIEEAKDKYEKSLEIKEYLLKNDSENVLYQSDLALTLNSLGNLFKDLGRLGEAKDRFEKALEIYEKTFKSDPENISHQSDLAMALNNLGIVLNNMGSFEEAKNRYEQALEIYEIILKTNHENMSYQSDFAVTLNNLGSLFSNMGHIEEAKDRYEKSIEIWGNILKTDPENIIYQSHVGTVLNNLGLLFFNKDLLEDAKNKYEESLAIYTEPMQHLTIGKKSQSIIKLIELNTKQAENESNLLNQTNFLKEVINLCEKYRDFFIKYELSHERKLVTEAGLSAYIDISMINVRFEENSSKRAKQYEKALQAVEKLSEIENDETVSKLFFSAACYLKGRKLVNEALTSKKPDLELLRKAVEQFKVARETYDKVNVSFCTKADICFCIYTGLLKILEKVENLVEVDVLTLNELIQEVVETLPENVDSGIRASFENIPQIFEETNKVARNELLKKLDEEIGNIEYKALEKLFGHVNEKIKEYFEEPFSPNLFYDKWRLRIKFDAEKMKGKLTVKTGNIILFDRVLSKEEIKENEIEIDFLERKYIPEGKDIIIFETPNQKSVVRYIDYSETISANKKSRIFLHSFAKGCSRRNLRVAAVQLKYDVYIEDSAVKIVDIEAYERKVMHILEAVKGEADIVVFPEFSIPFDYLVDIQEFANKNEIIVFAGTHYITEENLEKYEDLFASNFGEEDFRKNICPVIIPNSRIKHSEKMFGAKEERALFSSNGMKQGKLNHIFRLWDNLNIGVLICFEYLSDELRHRLIPTCDVILVPQTNPGPERFYHTAKYDLNNPLCAGNKACIMANGIFRIGKLENNLFKPDKDEILGGSSGIILTLDKDSNRMLDEGIFSQKEQFILLSTINLQYSAARDIQIAPEPIKTSIIHIFEENEIKLTQEENKENFLTFLSNIKAYTDRKGIKNLLEKNRSLIEKFSPLMHERTSNLNNLDFEEIREKCRSILISAS